MRASGDLAGARKELDGVLTSMQSGLGLPEHPLTRHAEDALAHLPSQQ
jgi:hypothetical protein